MKTEFYDYLKIIGITGSLLKRIEDIYEIYNTSICPEEITDLFINE